MENIDVKSSKVNEKENLNDLKTLSVEISQKYGKYYIESNDLTAIVNLLYELNAVQCDKP